MSKIPFVNKEQVGGRHYVDMKMQPWELIETTCLDFFYGTVVEYVSRWRKKGGVEDLKKARHIVEHMKLTEHQLYIMPNSAGRVHLYHQLNNLDTWAVRVINLLLEMEYTAALNVLDQTISSMQTNQEGDSL